MKNYLLKLLVISFSLSIGLPGYAAGGNLEPLGLSPSGYEMGEEGEGEVSFDSSLSPIRYSCLPGYGGEVNEYVYFSLAGFSSEMYLRVQLADASSAAGVQISVGSSIDENYHLLSFDNKGGSWIPEGYCHTDGGNTELTLQFVCSSEATVEYSVSVYSSQDASTPALASTQQKVMFIPGENFPQLVQPSRISGNLNEKIPLEVEVQAGILTGKAAKILIRPHLEKGSESFSITGLGIAANENGEYVCDIPSLQSKLYSFQVSATSDCKGDYSIELLDGEDITVEWSPSASILIPIEFSETDVNALKAIAEANPMNKDLQDFIEKEDYKKDRPFSDGYNVGVVWNNEQPSRVKEFYIRDHENKVKELNLSPLTALERVSIQGTNIKSLALSTLTGLRNLELSNTPLQFKDVTLPSFSSPEDFYCYGYTNIEATGATPVDEYTAYAASGIEIDLSAYAEVNGEKSNYQWYKQDPDTYERTETIMKSAGSDGKFMLEGKPGEMYLCNITNPIFKNWSMETPRIKIARDAATYSQTDIDGLKKLAADNPDVPQLQEFVDSKGWEHENWDSYQDNIRTNWSSDETGRLTHLAILIDWAEHPDSISVLDLSAFAELEYFECEQYMNISKLDLTHNTKLKHLHIYSRNLEDIDVSMCPDLEVFKFCTEITWESISEYKATKLQRINLSGCRNLKTLKLEHTHLANQNLSSFSQLEELHIENCRNLPGETLRNLPAVRRLSLPNTTQFEAVLSNLPSSVIELYLEGTTYQLPSVERLANLQALGVPANLETIDLAQFPQLNRLEVGHSNSKLTYSKVKNYGKVKYFNGRSQIQLKSPSHPESTYQFENGDTIDLSSEAVINGIETVFLWVNAKVRIEEKNAFKPVPDRPGVFVLDSQEEVYGDYYCKLMNPQFCEITDINVYGGWQMETSRIHVETSRPQIFGERDVQALATIVRESTGKEIKEWWDSNAWQQAETTSNIKAVWNNEEPRRLTSLFINNQGNGLTSTIDLSPFDRLEEIVLQANQLTKLDLPKNPERLRKVIVSGNKDLKSLIVTPYAALEYLDVSHTALTACDVTNNEQLKALILNGTSIPAVETTDSTLAAQLESYGVPKGITSIDLEQFPALQRLDATGSQLRFSGVRNPRVLEPVNTSVIYPFGTIRGAYSPYGATLDHSAEMMIGDKPSTIAWKDIDMTGQNITDIEADGTYTITDGIKPGHSIEAIIRNEMFPGWEMHLLTTVYTQDGDANLDKQVNVQDVVATVSQILGDPAYMLPTFGFAEADVNYNDKLEVADVIGIVNLIQGRLVRKAGTLRADYEPFVSLEVDAKGFLTMNSPVAIAGIQLELTGATTTLSLLGEAAKFIQASTLQGDTLRILAYTMDGTTLPSGKTLLMQLPAGVKLNAATFADAEANALNAKSDIVATGNEVIAASAESVTVHNYPNPFQGSTTFSYRLKERATNVSIQIFSADGALVSVLSGLPGEEGANRYTASIHLPAGLYYYHLLIPYDGRPTVSETSLFIIK